MHDTALVLFDTIITLDQEVATIWRSKTKWGLGSWLYLLNRYTAVVYFVIPFAQIKTESVSRTTTLLLYCCLTMFMLL